MAENDFDDLAFSEVVFYSEMIDRKKVEDQRERLIQSAFGAYLQGAGKEKTWSAYLQALGLIEKPKPVTKEAKKKIVQKSKSIAARIMRMDRKKKNAR